MPNFETVLQDARLLSDAERVRLIHTLWDEVPEDSELSLDPEWDAEIARRVAALKSGEAQTIPWETVLADALARIEHGPKN